MILWVTELNIFCLKLRKLLLVPLNGNPPSWRCRAISLSKPSLVLLKVFFLQISETGQRLQGLVQPNIESLLYWLVGETLQRILKITVWPLLTLITNMLLWTHNTLYTIQYPTLHRIIRTGPSCRLSINCSQCSAGSSCAKKVLRFYNERVRNYYLFISNLSII